VDSVVLTAALAVVQVDGAFPTAEMEGNQLLIGRYALFNRKYVAKVLNINRNLTASVEIIDTSNQNRVIKDNVSVR